MKAGLESLESLHRCKQVCTKWNEKILWDMNGKDNEEEFVRGLRNQRQEKSLLLKVEITNIQGNITVVTGSLFITIPLNINQQSQENFQAVYLYLDQIFVFYVRIKVNCLECLFPHLPWAGIKILKKETNC